MAGIDKIASPSTAELLQQKNNLNTQENSGGFADKLKEALEDVNELQEKGDEAMADMATGQVKDLHQAAIAIGKAEMSMKMMLEIRNKALNAYKELSRTQL
ncbi:MAG: flagellar hook-basal body complex protein FliE [Epsilonproteobacteria bacterium]|nr:flagellar hook-basal body complex protein FliE [Campylobacterota bacterium]